MRRLLPVLCLLALLAGDLPAASASPASYAIAELNAERAQNGIPDSVVEVPDWSARCAQHDSYMEKTGVLAHPEDPSNAAYTDAGNWAGTRSVLASVPWSASSGDPWDNAPIHLDQLLQPGLTESGYADDGKFTCMVTWPGVTDFDVPGVFTVPGDGRTDVPASQTALELPTTPAQQVGLAADATTGPNLIVYAANAQSIASASLVGPAGAVELRVMDNTGPYGDYIAPGGILVPVTPLAADADYTASVVINTSAGQVSKSWHFHTQMLDNTVDLTAAPESQMEVQRDNSLLAVHGSAKVHIGAGSTAPNATLMATSTSGATRTQSLTFTSQDADAGGLGVTLSLSPGTWRVCLASGGPGTGYKAASTCADNLVRVKADTQAPWLRVVAYRYPHDLVKLWIDASDNSRLAVRVRFRLGSGAWRTTRAYTTLLRSTPRHLRITATATDWAGHRAVRTLIVP
jgi:hypothetical protein